MKSLQKLDQSKSCEMLLEQARKPRSYTDDDALTMMILMTLAVVGVLLVVGVVGMVIQEQDQDNVH